MSEPAGIVMPFAGSVAPDGWLLCDGSAVSRTDYVDLFTAIGITYGNGDGSSTFNIPDLTGRVVIGVSGSHALGSTGGEASHVLTESELPAHAHEVPSHGHDNDITATTPELSHSITQPSFTYVYSSGTLRTSTGSGAWAYNSTGNATASRATNAAVGDHAASDCTVSGGVLSSEEYDSGTYGGDESHNNLQPYLVVTYIISTGV